MATAKSSAASNAQPNLEKLVNQMIEESPRPLLRLALVLRFYDERPIHEIIKECVAAESYVLTGRPPERIDQGESKETAE